jgi:hypothetical protein
VTLTALEGSRITAEEFPSVQFSRIAFSGYNGVNELGLLPTEKRDNSDSPSLELFIAKNCVYLIGNCLSLLVVTVMRVTRATP